VRHVVNYECPEDDKAYLHRTGRTGRAGRTGVAVTFVDWADLQRWKLINDALGLGQPEPAETYSTSEHLYSSLGIPRDATGTLPAAKRDRLGLEAEDLEDIGETGRSRSPAGGASRGARTRTGHGDSARGGRGDSARSRETGQREQRVRRRTRSGVAIGEPQRDRAATAETPGAGPGEADQGGRYQPAGRRRRPSRRRGRRGGAAGQATGASTTPSPGGES